VDFKLTDEQRLLVETVRALSQKQFKPNAQKYMDGTFPWENFKALSAIGIMGMAVPAQYGGQEMSIFDTALVLEEIAKACYVTAINLMGMLGTQPRIISTFAPEAIKRRILPSVVAGDCVLAICMTEPHAGTDVANFRTNTTVNGDKAVLNGVKTLISRAEEAGMFIVFTRIDARPGREGIGCVLIEKGTPGFEITGKFHTMGGEYLAELRFDNCVLPRENLIIADNGFKKLLNAFNTQRCLNPSISLGLAEGAFEESVRYMRSRTVAGKTLSEFQGMRWKLADMYRDIEVGRSMLYRACASANPFPDPHLAATAKMYCNDMANRVTSEAIQIHGGYGFTDEYAVSRFYRGARYGSLGGGTTETLRNLVSAKILDDFDDAHGFLAPAMHTY
jgi:alkylation response protein AidB-like acyl-CoA dehydrogenase